LSHMQGVTNLRQQAPCGLLKISICNGCSIDLCKMILACARLKNKHTELWDRTPTLLALVKKNVSPSNLSRNRFRAAVQAAYAMTQQNSSHQLSGCF